MASSFLVNRMQITRLNCFIHRCFHAQSQSARSSSWSSERKNKIKVGQILPDVKVFENSPDNFFSIRELFTGKKGVLFAVPGAFTPGCTQGHIPEYLQNYEKFKKEGYSVVACVTVNDPFVTAAWCKDVGAEGKIRMLADPKCDFTKAINMELDCMKLLGGHRSQRYSMLIEDNVVKFISMEPDDTGLACLLCIQKMKKIGTHEVKAEAGINR